MHEIFEQIAKNNGITVEEVVKEMEIAIAEAYKNPTPAALAIPCKGKIPTPEEFIKHVASEVQSKM